MRPSILHAKKQFEGRYEEFFERHDHVCDSNRAEPARPLRASQTCGKSIFPGSVQHPARECNPFRSLPDDYSGGVVSL
jgi:hypothetical protein